MSTFEIGARVRNHRFGDGTVVGHCGHLSYVRFDSGTHSNESDHYLTRLPAETTTTGTMTRTHDDSMPIPTHVTETTLVKAEVLGSMRRKIHAAGGTIVSSYSTLSGTYRVIAAYPTH